MTPPSDAALRLPATRARPSGRARDDARRSAYRAALAQLDEFPGRRADGRARVATRASVLCP